MKKIRQNIECICKRKKCERHGDCVACKEHHHNSTREKLTTCERLDVVKSSNEIEVLLQAMNVLQR